MANAKRNSFIVLGILLTAAVLVLASCVNYSTDGTAAQVNDTKITEDALTAKIQDFRTQQNFTTDEAWQDYLSATKQTTKSLRDSFLESMIDAEVYCQIAEGYGITGTDDDDIQYQVSQKFIDEAKPSKEAYGQLLAVYSEKFNGSKGYYQLLWKNSEEARAKQVYSQIKSGALSFNDAVAQRMKEDTTGANFAYVIYDCLIINPDECKPVLAGLHPGQMSNLVKTKNYIYMFYVVDEISCSVPLTSLSDLSEYTQENLKYYSKVMDQSNIVNTEFQNRKKTFHIIKYDCPQNLPY